MNEVRHGRSVIVAHGRARSWRPGPGRQDVGAAGRCPDPRRRHRAHVLGVARHGGPLLDHLQVGAKRNETSHFTELLGPADLTDAVVTFDALHTVRANLDWLVTDKKAPYIAVVSSAQAASVPWATSPTSSDSRPPPGWQGNEVCENLGCFPGGQIFLDRDQAVR